jgi:hypothetical protein
VIAVQLLRTWLRITGAALHKEEINKRGKQKERK